MLQGLLKLRRLLAATFRFSAVVAQCCRDRMGSIEPGFLKRRVGISERDRPSQRSWPSPDGMAVIAALHDPLAIFLTNDLANVVPPDDDRAD
jgi:hypothetical protein